MVGNVASFFPGVPVFLRPLAGEPITQRTLGRLAPAPASAPTRSTRPGALPSLPAGFTGPLPTMPAALFLNLPQSPGGQNLPRPAPGQRPLPTLFPLPQPAPFPPPGGPLPGPGAPPPPTRESVPSAPQPSDLPLGGWLRSLPVYSSSLRALLAVARGGGAWPPPPPAMPPLGACFRKAPSRGVRGAAQARSDDEGLLAVIRGGATKPGRAHRTPQQANYGNRLLAAAAYRDAVTGSALHLPASMASAGIARMGAPGGLPSPDEPPASKEEVLAILRQYTFGSKK